MEPLTAETLCGIWGTVLLPIRDDNSIDFDAAGVDLDYLMRSRISGIYTNGTAGEFDRQSEDEFDRLQRQVADICTRFGLAFQVGASHTDEPTSIDRILRSRTLGPGAFQVMIPRAASGDISRAASFLGAAARAAEGVPLVLYDPPSHPSGLMWTQYRQLAERTEALIGLKVGPAKPGDYAALVADCPKLSVFVPGHHVVTGLRAGARGSYSNIACLQPRGAQRWYELALSDEAAAAQLESRIQSFLGRRIAPLRGLGHGPAALDKLLSAIGGWSCAGTRVRPPGRSIPDSQVPALAEEVRTGLPELFEGFD